MTNSCRGQSCEAGVWGGLGVAAPEAGCEGRPLSPGEGMSPVGLRR